MKVKRIIFSLILFLAGGLLQVSASAKDWFSFSIDQSAAYQGDTIQLQIHAEKNDLEEAIAGFRLIVEYDGDQLTMKRTKTSDQVQSGAFRSYIGDDSTVGVYVCNGAYAPKLRGDCITFEFAVNEEAEPGKTELSVKMDQIVDWFGSLFLETYSADLSLKIKPPLSSQAVLSSLVPSVGYLEPPFSPEIQEYQLEVEAEVDAVDFNTETLEGGTVKVNRRTLLKAGSSTEIVLTVTSADKQEKTQYLVDVMRKGYEEIPAIIKEKSSSASPKGESESKTALVSNTASQFLQETGKESEPDRHGESLSSENPTVIYGDRNLYIVGGQDSSNLLWILIACVCVLILVTVWNGRSHQRNNK